MLRPTLAGRQGGFHLTRVAAYIDGFNLYHGLRSKHGHKYLWLDLELLVTKLLKPHQELAVVRYFTASVRNDAPTLARESSYLGALGAHAPRLDIRLGRFQEKSLRCHRCGAAWRTCEEKETDVSIAVAVVEDAATDLSDVAPAARRPRP
ncbi:MAG: NYN domain-containing protein [Actinomycetota bacterium]|nr:NYN domain-containing protein [Actinomycetota bacterium]